MPMFPVDVWTYWTRSAKERSDDVAMDDENLAADDVASATTSKVTYSTTAVLGVHACGSTHPRCEVRALARGLPQESQSGLNPEGPVYATPSLANSIIRYDIKLHWLARPPNGRMLQTMDAVKGAREHTRRAPIKRAPEEG
jgi:hypothetical protein